MWEATYRKAFVGFERMRYVTDRDKQRRGIDREITLAGGRVVTVDEKVRKDRWDDILIEYWSVWVPDKSRRQPGWIAKGQYCDYIAYAFNPSKTCYLFPFQSLRRAWRDNRESWIKSFKGRCPGKGRTPNKGGATNGGYDTLWCTVEIPELLMAVADAMIVKLGPAELPQAIPFAR